MNCAYTEPNKAIFFLWQILGHDIAPEEVRLMYTFDGGERTDKYEAHSDNDVLILLDCTPDQVSLVVYYYKQISFALSQIDTFLMGGDVLRSYQG